jgi:hypothetical protein
MNRWIGNIAVPTAVCTLVSTGVDPAILLPGPHSSSIGYSNPHFGVELALVAVGLGAVVGFGIYYETHHKSYPITLIGTNIWSAA